MRPPPAASPAWTAELGLRMRRMFLLKFVGTSAWIWVFFIGYFHVLRHPVHPVTLMPSTALDTLIPFQPSMLYPYLSLWLYVGIAPGLQLTFRALLAYGLWTAALCLTGLAIFYGWPTAVAPLVVDVSGMAGFRMLQGVDAAGNACPSMHVAFAMFSAVWIEHLLRQARAPTMMRLLNLAWFLAITWSTLAIRQHVVLDAVAGALLGLAFALPSLRWRPRTADGRGAAKGAAIIDRMPADIAS
jgi:hypothetical protein